VNCQTQTAKCLRHVPADTLVGTFPDAAIPGVVDGKVLTEPLGAALAAGRFAHVPVINGVNQNEELLFVAGLGAAVSGGRFVLAPTPTDETSYESVIASVLGVSESRAAAVAAEYPFGAYPPPGFFALSTLVSDAEFACPALQVDRWMSKRAPTFAYEFDDGTAPPIFAGPGFPPFATHSSEIQYLFDQPNAKYAAPLNAEQETLAASMRKAWTNFAARGRPSTAAVSWPSFNRSSDVLSLALPQPQVESSFAMTHHCAFWDAG
jgi:para-nitrobenzyl esterase